MNVYIYNNVVHKTHKCKETRAGIKRMHRQLVIVIQRL